MLSKEDNELMCRVGPDTPMGQALRRYWVPALQSSDLPAPDGDPRHVQLLGEHFVAFRDTNGDVGILDELCCHRGASLVLGRVEGCGIRCLYHGWKFAIDGTVMETPNVADPSFKTRIKARAYPVQEAGGLIWAYLGPEELKPPFPHYPWFDLPAEYRLNAYLVENSNYVQVAEALVDSSHLNILHADGLRSGDGSDLHFAQAAGLMQVDAAPRLEVDDTEFGFHYAALRGGGDAGELEVRITAWVAPFAVVNPNQDLWMAVVPINDEQSIYFHVFYDAERKIGIEPLRSEQLKFIGLDDEAIRNFGLTYDTLADREKPSRSNRFLQDRAAMRDGRFSGFHSFTQEDAAVIQSAGRIKDRTKETLSPADAAVMRLYRTLIGIARSVAAGGDPVGLGADPMQIFGAFRKIPSDQDWRTIVPTHVVTKRQRAARTASAA